MTDRPNPFIDANIELRLDDLLNGAIDKALRNTESSLRVTISRSTLRKIQTLVWDAVPGASILQAEKAGLVAVEALGLEIREDKPDESQ